MLIQTMRLSFSDNRIRYSDVSRVRGYIARKFPQYIELHHHIEKDRLLYKYPCIQYKAIKEIPTIIAVHSGVAILKEIYDKVEEIKISTSHQPIYEKQIIMKNEPFGESNEFYTYEFLTPWLALNQDRYREYKSIEKSKRNEMLNKILIGNIISMAKTLRYTIQEEIKAETHVIPMSVSLKGNSMIGFLGEFKINFHLPDLIGLGKSVSRGFGTIKRIEPCS
jgi:hypothetical protein